MSKAGRGSVAFVKNTTSATVDKVSDLSEKAVETVRPTGIHVVEVREKDLKKMESGHDRALAYENTRKRSFWFFEGPVDLPQLPESDLQVDGGDDVNVLLPPITE